MAGNRTRFKVALQRASDLVWEEKWARAIKEYQRALKEFPQDVSALQGYAWALFNQHDLAAAEQVYLHLTQLTPADPVPHERLARLLAQRGQHQDSVSQYQQAASCYRARGMLEPQIGALEAAVRLTPHNAKTWTDLLELYREENSLDDVIRATLWLAYLHQEEDPQLALEICRQTQEIAPQNQRLAQTLTLLQRQAPLPQPTSTDELDEILTPSHAGEEREESPTAIAQRHALASLAESIFAEEAPRATAVSPAQVTILISQAVEAQTQGNLDAAQKSYERLVNSGVSMPSLHFNLGMLYKEQMNFTAAIEQLERAFKDKEYLLAAHFALGECYRAEGEFDSAFEHFLEAVKVVDLATVEREQVDDLLRVYEGLAQSLINTGEPEHIRKLLPALVDFLSQRGWEEEASKARHRLDGLARSGIVLSLAEIISLPNSDEVLHSVALSQEYISRGKPYSALEELMHAIGRAPFYLPLHSMLANLFIENNNIDASLNKYRVIAKTCEIRGQIPQALATYQQIVEYSPLDEKIRRRLIELLIQHGQIDKALEQYLQLSDSYYQLAQLNRARETYQQALHLAPRGSASEQWQLRILHRLADLDMQRLAWADAIKDYEEITRIAPGDERAHLGLMRLYPRTGRQHLGIAALDRLIKVYLKTQRVGKALAVLEDLVEDEPDSIPLRYRAAQLSLRTHKQEKALEHLDILGNLQLEAGKEQAAFQTIRSIISLKPPNLEGYVQLYEELSGQTPKLA
ncbi:MAG TPA: tetratricopeptide repeat protein [Thermoflexia bacterium]|nr:tetratricopeptide repeat protein [Thermoflexia bacterium]